jgi:hypothetical protein
MSIGASLGNILSGKEGGSLGGILENDGALLQRLGLHQEQPHHRLLLKNNHTVSVPDPDIFVWITPTKN